MPARREVGLDPEPKLQLIDDAVATAVQYRPILLDETAHCFPRVFTRNELEQKRIESFEWTGEAANIGFEGAGRPGHSVVSPNSGARELLKTPGGPSLRIGQGSY